MSFSRCAIYPRETCLYGPGAHFGNTTCPRIKEAAAAKEDPEESAKSCRKRKLTRVEWNNIAIQGG